MLCEDRALAPQLPSGAQDVPATANLKPGPRDQNGFTDRTGLVYFVEIKIIQYFEKGILNC